MAIVGNTIFWANAQKEVYKFNSSRGVIKISDLGMRSYFRNMFSELQASPGNLRVVGGYDINHDEYIISAYNQNFIDFTADVSPDQDLVAFSDLEGDEFTNLNEGTPGDLSIADAVDLLESVGATVIATGSLSLLQSQIESQEAEIAALLAELAALQAEVGDDDVVIGTTFEDVLNQLNEVQQALLAQRNTLIQQMDDQVLYHQSIRAQAQQVLNSSLAQLNQIGFTYDPFVSDNPQNPTSLPTPEVNYNDQIITAVEGSSLNVPALNDVDNLNYTGFNQAVGLTGLQPKQDVANYLALQAQEAANIVFAYSTEPTIITYREASFYGAEDVDYEIETGYGVGPVPVEDSYLGQHILSYLNGEGFYTPTNPLFQQGLADSALLLPRNSEELSAAASEIFTFSNDTQTVLSNVVAESNSRLEGLASQIYQISLAIKNYQMPDLASDDPNNIPDSVLDYTVDAQITIDDIADLDETGQFQLNENVEGLIYKFHHADRGQPTGNPSLFGG